MQNQSQTLDIGVYFFIPGFFTAIKQGFARQNKAAVDSVSLNVQLSIGESTV